MATRRCTCGKVTAVGDIHTCSPQVAAEGLTWALAIWASDNGIGDVSLIEDNAEALAPILARFASPEVKREVLAALLKERCPELTANDWRLLADSAGQASYWTPYLRNIGQREFAKALAPLEAP